VWSYPALRRLTVAWRLVPTPVLALGALAVIGAGNSLLDVSGFTLLQRLGDDRALGRVFGVLFTAGIAFGGVGAIVAPAAVDALGLRLSLVSTVPGNEVIVRQGDPADRFRSTGRRSWMR
jgi:hypothetical protein